jgi:hypothetical protein
MFGSLQDRQPGDINKGMKEQQILSKIPIFARICTVALKRQQCFPSVLLSHITVNNVKLLRVAMEMQQWVPFALLSGYKAFSIVLLRSSRKVPYRSVRIQIWIF